MINDIKLSDTELETQFKELLIETPINIKSCNQFISKHDIFFSNQPWVIDDLNSVEFFVSEIILIKDKPCVSTYILKKNVKIHTNNNISIVEFMEQCRPLVTAGLQGTAVPVVLNRSGPTIEDLGFDTTNPEEMTSYKSVRKRNKYTLVDQPICNNK